MAVPHTPVIVCFPDNFLATSRRERTLASRSRTRVLRAASSWIGAPLNAANRWAKGSPHGRAESACCASVSRFGASGRDSSARAQGSRPWSRAAAQVLGLQSLVPRTCRSRSSGAACRGGPSARTCAPGNADRITVKAKQRNTAPFTKNPPLGGSLAKVPARPMPSPGIRPNTRTAASPALVL
jgi:hypothetical protein